MSPSKPAAGIPTARPGLISRIRNLLPGARK
jgi:hypothetical protein